MSELADDLKGDDVQHDYHSLGTESLVLFAYSNLTIFKGKVKIAPCSLIVYKTKPKKTNRNLS